MTYSLTESVMPPVHGLWQRSKNVCFSD